MKYKKGICSSCGHERYYVNVSKQLCSMCNANRLKDKRKPIKQIPKFSTKQLDIQKSYVKMLKEFDMNMPHCCLGCGKKEGEVILSHSHIISRADAKGIGMPELIYDKNNIQYLCMSMGDNHTGCHSIWESKKRNILRCYEDNMLYIKSISDKLYNKYVV